MRYNLGACELTIIYLGEALEHNKNNTNIICNESYMKEIGYEKWAIQG